MTERMPGRSDVPGDPEPPVGDRWNAQTTQLWATPPGAVGRPDEPGADRWPPAPRSGPGRPGPAEPETGGWRAPPQAGGRPAEPGTGGWRAGSAMPRTGSGYPGPAGPQTGAWSSGPQTGARPSPPQTGGWSAEPATGGWSAEPRTGAWSPPPAGGRSSGPAPGGGYGPGAPVPPATQTGAPEAGAPRQAPASPGPVTQMLAAALPDPETMPRSRQRALARAQARQRRRRMLILGALLVAVILIGADLITGRPVGGGGHRAASHPSAAPPHSAPVGAGPSVPVPQSGPGTFAYAAGTGPTIGSKGTLHQYRVAVENGTGQDAAAFADAAQQTLADPRGWIAGGDVRFQRVAQNANAGFTLYLATPATSERMCGQGGIHTQQLISCRLPGQVIINLARWLNAIPGYGASLQTYQQFTINHEVGREIGHGDEGCPAPGVLAPVMQEQTLGLKGCVANAWPYVNGKLYTGPAVP